ncbi:MAG: DNA translocase FtsK 4TM domain-containing protein [Candidatus Binataceae bacterium]
MPRQPEPPVTRPLAVTTGDAASDNTGDITGSIARELGALGLAAIAAFTGLSLVSYDLASHSNLAGPLGYRLAAALTESLGVQSYIVAALIGWMAAKVWSAEGLDALRRSALGGSILVTALSAAIALLIAGDPQASGAIGRDMAAWLERYLSFGGSLMVLSLAIICGVVLLVERAPTDLIRGGLGRLRRPRAHGDTDLEDFDSDVHVLDAADEYADEHEEDDGAPVTVTEPREPLAPSAGRAPARPRGKSGFKLPSLSLLDSPSLTRTGFDEAALEKSARLLEQKLAAFSVDGHVVEVQPGPVVTMFKFEPGSGVKVSQIVNLADDLSLAMKAPAVRIQAPVPGEAVVGIEVPNRKREKIYLREILESEEFRAAQGHLVIALGKDISGRPVVADLARMPHLLIAGATGTGKSVAIHTMISSILFNSTDDDVRFILIDPKMLELSAYEQVPHLLVPVVVDPDKAAAALLWATQEMEYRYRLMRDKGVRNIEGYNQAVAKTTPSAKPPAAEQSSPDARPLEHRRLPKIVIVIDELADLLLHEGKTVERDITRLAQKARASGIHLILATQRPSVDVITGLIKANLPARISLQVTSRVDSRTILDSIGAERLLGEGDMLFMPPGTAKLRRLHGPFVSEVEIRKVTDFLRAQGAPEYQMEILETKRPEAGDADGLGGLAQDEMYDEAVRIVIESNQASISMIQRRLRIGYNRAARMVEQMEREGLVLPADGARPREVRGLRGAG